MLTWLQSADTPLSKRRRASTDDDSPDVRKRVHQGIASFFRSTGVRPDYAQLQQRILERGSDELDMDSWRNAFQVPDFESCAAMFSNTLMTKFGLYGERFQSATPQTKAALLESCRRIKEVGRESMQLKLHAADPGVGASTCDAIGATHLI